MSRRHSDVHVLTCPLTAEEADVVNEMKRQCAVDSDANLIRIALWSLSNEWDIDSPIGAFDCRSIPGYVANCHAANARRHANKTPRVTNVRQKPVTPAPDHPWRNRKATA